VHFFDVSLIHTHTERAGRGDGDLQAAAPINPSDLNFLLTKESYIQYPCTWGNEGSGWVVATGGGPGTEGLLGKAVGISGQRGTYPTTHGSSGWGQG